MMNPDFAAAKAPRASALPGGSTGAHVSKETYKETCRGAKATCTLYLEANLVGDARDEGGWQGEVLYLV
jgi:hypothetical protein